MERGRVSLSYRGETEQCPYEPLFAMLPRELFPGPHRILCAASQTIMTVIGMKRTSFTWGVAISDRVPKNIMCGPCLPILRQSNDSAFELYGVRSDIKNCLDA